MTFNPGQMLVFDKTGARIGQLINWSITAPRTYRLSDVEDMGFVVPLANQAGVSYLDATVEALLARDNLVFIEDELATIPGWGGEIDEASFHDERCDVKVNGGIGLLIAVQTEEVIKQSAGMASNVAARLIAAANAKKGAHGDLNIGFVVDGDAPLYGTYEFDGDVFQGLRSLANDTLCEFWVEAILGPGATSLGFTVHWDHRRQVDHSAIIFKDGVGGNLKAGSQFIYSGREVLNRIRLRGTPTHLADFLNYDCIGAIVKDVTPEVDWEVPGAANQRRREALDLTVNFGLSDDAQKAIATTGYTDPVTGEHVPGIEEVYLGYYKTFLYAYHNRQGKPYLEGYDWSGPDGTNDKALIERYFRTWNKLGHTPSTTIITTDSDGGLPSATIEDWAFVNTSTTTTPVIAVALDYGHGSVWYVLTTANLLERWDLVFGAQEADDVPWSPVPGGATALSIATSPASPDSLWVLATLGGTPIIAEYSIDGQTLVLQYNLPVSSPTDIAVDAVSGLLYVGSSADGNIHVVDLNSGSAISPDPTFASGFADVEGISISGGVIYIANAAGDIRMLFLPAGTFAGSFATGAPLGVGGNALLVDPANHRIWLTHGGNIDQYDAYVAVGTLGGAGSLTGAPGFDEVHRGTYVHVVMTSDGAKSPSTKWSPHGSELYTVVAGDTLGKIAQRAYGVFSLWRTIYKVPSNRALIGPNPAHLVPGIALTIPARGVNAPATPATNRYYIQFTRGHWQQDTIPGPIGQPDQIQRSWFLDDDTPVTGYNHASVGGGPGIVIDDPAIVIEGEEGRVCDWNPTLDGYGVLLDEQLYKTKSGRILRAGQGWYPHDWDVPDRAFEPPPRPAWPEGELYAADFLAHKNREVTVQQLIVDNLDGLWGNIELGGIYTVQATKQGVRPGGIALQVRVLAFSPNEFSGELELIAEVN